MLEPIRIIIIKSVSPHFLMLLTKQLMFSMGRSAPLFHLDQSLVHCLDHKGNIYVNMMIINFHRHH